MDIKECYLSSMSGTDFINRWVATAEDRVLRDFRGNVMELTTMDSVMREFSTGAGNRRMKEREATRYLCLHYYNHRGDFFIEYYCDGEYLVGRDCSICNVNIW